MTGCVRDERRDSVQFLWSCKLLNQVFSIASLFPFRTSRDSDQGHSQPNVESGHIAKSDTMREAQLTASDDGTLRLGAESLTIPEGIGRVLWKFDFNISSTHPPLPSHTVVSHLTRLAPNSPNLILKVCNDFHLTRREVAIFCEDIFCFNL